MKLQFDPNQSHQLDAIAAVTHLFDGQPQGAPEYSVSDMGEWERDLRRATADRAGCRQPHAALGRDAACQRPRCSGPQ